MEFEFALYMIGQDQVHAVCKHTNQCTIPQSIAPRMAKLSITLQLPLCFMYYQNYFSIFMFCCITIFVVLVPFQNGVCW